NDTTPPAPDGKILCGFQKQDNLNTGKRSISMTVPIAQDGTLGVVKPDNSSILVAADGTMSSPSPITTEGDLIVGGASGVPSRLAAGPAGYVLTSSGPGTIPLFQPAGSGGGTSGGWTPTPPAAADFTVVRNGLSTTPTIADNVVGIGIEMTFLRSNVVSSWPQAYFLKNAPAAPFRAEALITN